MTKTKYKNKHKVTSKNKGFIVSLVCTGIILAVAFIWIVSVKLYPADSKVDVDNSSNKSVIEPIYKQQNTDNSTGKESGDGEVNQVLPSNNIKIPQGVTQVEEPSQSRMEAPQS